MIRRRRKDKHFVQINNETLRNPKLSLKAKGLLAVMMTNAEDWVFYMSELQKQSTDGREAHQSAMKELEQHRYVVRLRMQRPNGTFKGWQYIVDDEPIRDVEPGSVVMVEDEEEPTDGKPVNRLATDERENRLTGKPSDGKPATKKNKEKNINPKEEEDAHAQGAATTPAPASSSEKDSAAPTQKPEATEAELEAGHDPLLDALLGPDDQPTAGDTQDQAPDTENVPGARETVHEDEQPEQDPAAVAQALSRILGPRWAQPYSAYNQQTQTTEQKPAWIDEMSRLGVDRHRIPQLVPLSQVAALESEARAAVAQAQASFSAGVTSQRPRSFQYLFIRSLEQYVLERDAIRQQIEAMVVAQTASQPESEVGSAAPAAPAQAQDRAGHQGYAVGDDVLYLGQTYQVEAISGGKICIYSDEYGSVDVLVNSSDMDRLRRVRSAVVPDLG